MSQIIKHTYILQTCWGERIYPGSEKLVKLYCKVKCFNFSQLHCKPGFYKKRLEISLVFTGKLGTHSMSSGGKTGYEHQY